MIGISSAIVLADEVSKQMFNHEQTQQFLEVLDQFVGQAIEDVTGPATDVQDEDAMNQVFSAIAFQFFAAGIVWGKQVKEKKMLWMDPVTKTWGEGDLYTIDPIHYVDVIQAEIEEAIKEGDEEKLLSLIMQYGRKVK